MIIVQLPFGLESRSSFLIVLAVEILKLGPTCGNLKDTLIHLDGLNLVLWLFLVRLTVGLLLKWLESVFWCGCICSSIYFVGVTVHKDLWLEWFSFRFKDLTYTIKN